MGDLTRHFSWREFECRCGCPMPFEVRERVRLLAETLESLRAWIGEPIRINSGYRCPARNEKVGGKPKSRHLRGEAVDMEVAGYTGKRLAEIIEELIESKSMPEGGLGTYPNLPHIVHFDMRGRRARW